MNKKVKFLVFLFSIIIILSGCSNQLTENSGLSESGDGIVSLKINEPETKINKIVNSDKTAKIQSTSEEQITLSEVIIKIKKEDGSLIKEKTIDMANFDYEKPIALQNLPNEDLLVEVVVNDETGKVIYEGSAKTTIFTEATTNLAIKLKIAKGDLDVEVNIPADFTPDSGIVELNTTLENPEDVRTKSLNIDMSNGIATASFSDVKAGIYPLSIKLKNDSKTEIGEGQIFIRPSRTAKAVIDLVGNGDLNINLDWEYPPMPPEYLSVSTDNENGIVLNWPESTSSNVAGYMVYRSKSINGRKTLLTKEAIKKTTYLDNSELYEGTNYVYWVQSYSENGIAGEFNSSSVIT
ncbi:MAG TPA: fibronectin type III domain-containing protein, partial [Halanaerobiales bacterium]|nr:fibronectin type III domain-containing protein [Halanaerobiales bacterium]